jgi:hypothetical protein
VIFHVHLGLPEAEIGGIAARAKPGGSLESLAAFGVVEVPCPLHHCHLMRTVVWLAGACES